MTIFSKSYLLDVWQSSEYASESGLLKYIYIRSKIGEKLIVFHCGAGYKISSTYTPLRISPVNVNISSGNWNIFTEELFNGKKLFIKFEQLL